MPEISGGWLYGLGIATGVIGMGLAFLTYWLRRRTQKTKLSVEVSRYRELSNNVLDVLALRVRMVNHSHFDVTISKIGLRVREHRFARRKHYMLEPTSPLSRDKPLPFRLDARDEETINIPIREKWWFSDGRVPTVETLFKATDVYVETSTEHRFYGREPGFRDFIETVREADLTKLRHW